MDISVQNSTLPGAGPRGARISAPWLVLAASLGLLLASCHRSEPDQVAVTIDRDLGAALFAEDRLEEAEAALTRVLESGAATPQDHVNLACLLLAMSPTLPVERERLLARATEQLDLATDQDPECVPAWYCRGVVALRRLDFDAAAVAFEHVLTRFPDDPAARLNLAQALKDRGEDARSEQELLTILDQGVEFGGSFYASALHRLAMLAIRSGDPERVTEGKRWLDEKVELQSRGVTAPTLQQLERGIFGQVTVPGPHARTGRASAADVVFEPRPTGRFTTLGELRELALADIDGDGRLDLLAAGATGAAASRGTGPDAYDEEAIAAGDWRRIVAGDLDNDGKTSVLLLGADGVRLATRTEDGWRDDSAALPADVREGLRVEDARFVDVDHEGDLDLVLAGGTGLRLLRNDGATEEGGPVAFVDVTETIPGAATPREWIVMLDADEDHDVDLLAGGGNASPILLSNLRRGRFADIAADASGLTDARGAAIPADLDHDGWSDLLFVRDGRVEWRRNRTDGTFEPPVVVPIEDVAGAGTLADVDRDGEQDLVARRADGTLAVWLGSLVAGTSVAAREPGPGTMAPAFGPPAIGDLDGDGDLDLLAIHGAGAVIRRNAGPRPTDALRLRLVGKKDNRSAVGTLVEVRSGALYQHRLVERPDVIFGLAGADRADVVRVTWPNGVVQHAIRPTADQPLVLEQKSGLVGSCPFLYTWNGEELEFVTDVLGAGPLGLPMARGAYVPPNHDELVRIEARQLRPRDGAYELSLTEELREVTYLDRVELLVVDHPTDVEVHPEERFTFPPFPAKTIHAVRDVRPLVRATGSDGEDWTAALREIDGEHAAPFTLPPPQFLGLAHPHHLDLVLPDAVRDAARIRLLMTGWFFWTDASVNVAAADHPAHAFLAPTLHVPDGAGGFRPAGPPVGFPTGKTKTMVLDVTDIVDRGDPRLRLTSGLRLYWDCIRVAVDDGDAPLQVTRVDPMSAALRYRGFSAALPALGPDRPERFDYTRLRPPPWNQHVGMLTRYGDVLPLLLEVDDRFALFSGGDELRLRFPAEAPPEGMARTFLLYLDGWAKDGDPNTVSSATVEPLPFHGMSGYPYRSDESYPDDPEHRAYRAEWNTRAGRRLIEDLTEPTPAAVGARERSSRAGR